jgi:hypothetical protein
MPIAQFGVNPGRIDIRDLGTQNERLGARSP